MAYLSTQKIDMQAHAIGRSNLDSYASQNPYDVHLLDPKEAVLFRGEFSRYQFTDYEAFQPRFVVVTKSAIRLYESADKSVSAHGKPLIAIPLAAVQKIEKIRFDAHDDERLKEESAVPSAANMIEFFIKDNFLPIYTHQQYSKAFKDQSLMMEKSPGKRSSMHDGSKMSSPGRGSNVSRSSAFISPGQSRLGQSQFKGSNASITMSNRGGHQFKESPSKAAKITLQYINKYQDVGPKKKGQTVTQEDLEGMALNIDKKDAWLKSDLRLIFGLSDTTLMEEHLQTLQKVIVDCENAKEDGQIFHN
jgi:hypothetical protein